MIRKKYCQMLNDFRKKFFTENQILSSTIETPNDIEDKYNISGGHWSHGDMEIDQLLMMRPFYGSSQYSTPINGLYLCSAGTILVVGNRH
ncbi:MAG: hypothetical protein CM1200mP13_12890 [Candidatus Pelagibacterales bacterium]|nr:MAG: hypothetical protein CM1200mP13_12890 [Pelagibacterales bacterium]